MLRQDDYLNGGRDKLHTDAKDSNTVGSVIRETVQEISNVANAEEQ